MTASTKRALGDSDLAGLDFLLRLDASFGFSMPPCVRPYENLR